jgi:hypothetical protein
VQRCVALQVLRTKSQGLIESGAETIDLSTKSTIHTKRRPFRERQRRREKKNLIEKRAPTHTSTAIPPKIKTKQAGGDKSKLRLQNKILIIQKATRILRQCELRSKQQKNRTNFDGESIKPLNVFHKGAAIYLIKIRINHPEMSPKNATHPASSPRI